MTEKRTLTSKLRKNDVSNGRLLTVALQAAKWIRTSPNLGDEILIRSETLLGNNPGEYYVEESEVETRKKGKGSKEKTKRKIFRRFLLDIIVSETFSKH